MRYMEHKNAKRDPSQFEHKVIVIDESPGFWAGLRRRFHNGKILGNGFVNQRHNRANPLSGAPASSLTFA